eukprot:jgi/Bigna1/68356/fgenesh1_pg.6_\
MEHKRSSRSASIDSQKSQGSYRGEVEIDLGNDVGVPIFSRLKTSPPILPGARAKRGEMPAVPALAKKTDSRPGSRGSSGLKPISARSRSSQREYLWAKRSCTPDAIDTSDKNDSSPTGVRLRSTSAVNPTTTTPSPDDLNELVLSDDEPTSTYSGNQNSSEDGPERSSWRVMWKDGVSIRAEPDEEAVLLGILTQGSVIQGIHLKNMWVKHSKGWSPVWDPYCEVVMMRRVASPTLPKRRASKVPNIQGSPPAIIAPSANRFSVKNPLFEKPMKLQPLTSSQESLASLNRSPNSSLTRTRSKSSIQTKRIERNRYGGSPDSGNTLGLSSSSNQLSDGGSRGGSPYKIEISLSAESINNNNPPALTSRLRGLESKSAKLKNSEIATRDDAASCIMERKNSPSYFGGTGALPPPLPLFSPTPKQSADDGLPNHLGLPMMAAPKLLAPQEHEQPPEKFFMTKGGSQEDLVHRVKKDFLQRMAVGAGQPPNIVFDSILKPNGASASYFKPDERGVLTPYYTPANASDTTLVKKGKAGCARIFVWRESEDRACLQTSHPQFQLSRKYLKVKSYTMEASFAGANHGAYAEDEGEGEEEHVAVGAVDVHPTIDFWFAVKEKLPREDLKDGKRCFSILQYEDQKQRAKIKRCLEEMSPKDTHVEEEGESDEDDSADSAEERPPGPGEKLLGLDMSCAIKAKVQATRSLLAKREEDQVRAVAKKRARTRKRGMRRRTAKANVRHKSLERDSAAKRILRKDRKKALHKSVKAPPASSMSPSAKARKLKERGWNRPSAEEPSSKDKKLLDRWRSPSSKVFGVRNIRLVIVFPVMLLVHLPTDHGGEKQLHCCRHDLIPYKSKREIICDYPSCLLKASKSLSVRKLSRRAIHSVRRERKAPLTMTPEPPARPLKGQCFTFEIPGGGRPQGRSGARKGGGWGGLYSQSPSYVSSPATKQSPHRRNNLPPVGALDQKLSVSSPSLIDMQHESQSSSKPPRAGIRRGFRGRYTDARSSSPHVKTPRGGASLGIKKSPPASLIIDNPEAKIKVLQHAKDFAGIAKPQQFARPPVANNSRRKYGIYEMIKQRPTSAKVKRSVNIGSFFGHSPKH